MFDQSEVSPVWLESQVRFAINVGMLRHMS